MKLGPKHSPFYFLSGQGCCTLLVITTTITIYCHVTAAALRAPKRQMRPQAKGRGSRAATRLHKQPALEHASPRPPPGCSKIRSTASLRGWMHEHCLPYGARSWKAGAPAVPGQEWAMVGSSCRQVTPSLATGSCFTQSKMNKHELALKQPQVSDVIHSPHLG